MDTFVRGTERGMQRSAAWAKADKRVLDQSFMVKMPSTFISGINKATKPPPAFLRFRGFRGPLIFPLFY
jgi:hypothetical protein